MLYFLGTGLAVFLFFILASKRRRSLPDVILMIWLLVIACNLFDYYLKISSQQLDFPFLLAVFTPLPLLHGPLLFLYTASLTNQLRRRFSAIAIHFLPFLVAYAVFFRFLMLPVAKKVEVYQLGGKGWEMESLTVIILIHISGVVYVIWSLLLLRRHRKNILQQFSAIENITLNWLTRLILGMLLIWVFVFWGNDDLIYSSVVVFIFFIGFYGIRQGGIFTESLQPGSTGSESANTSALFADKAITQEDPEDSDVNTPQESFPPAGLPETEHHETPVPDQAPKKKYQKSGLTTNAAKEIHQKLTELITVKKIYKDPELNLMQLAQMLQVAPNTLSQVINSIEQKTFYDYINDWRIAEFKEMATVPSNRKYTILALALECGFNSKTTFNRVFKKATGLSPTEYLNSFRDQTEG